MKIKNEKLRRAFRWAFGAFSVTAVAFVFQACYGPAPHEVLGDVKVEGKVMSAKTQEPINQIKVSVTDQPQYVETNENGSFELFIDNNLKNKLVLRFEDESEENGGTYLTKDTVIYDGGSELKTYIEIYLDEE